MPYFTYILYSKKLSRFYKGQTDDFENRIHRHNSGYELSTRSGVPWITVWVTTKADRSAAMGLEKKLKNLSVNRLIEFINKYEEGLTKEGRELILSAGFES